MAKAAFSESLNDYDQFPISDELPQETIASAVSTDKRWDLLRWNFKLGAGGRGESFTYSYKYVLIWTLPLIIKKKINTIPDHYKWYIKQGARQHKHFI